MSRTRVVEQHGLKWFDHGGSTDDFLSFSGHEEPVFYILNSMLPQDGVLLDIGSHVGLWSLRLAAKASKVYAFEANPPTYDTLVTNISLNRLGPTVKAINTALWDSNTSVRVKDWHGKTSGGSTACYEGGDIPAITLDEWVAEVRPERIDAIKIDTEGAESRILAGARSTITHYHPRLIIEMHGGFQNVPMSVNDDVFRILKELDYECSDLFTIGGGQHITAAPEAPWQEGEVV